MIQRRKCRTCSAEFAGGPRAFYCPACRAERKRVAERKYKSNGPSRKIGSIDKCQLCGKEYIVTGGLQRYCPECQPIHAAEYDRATSILFYHKNKSRINPVRNINRQRVVICKICGIEFKPHSASRYCSKECLRKGIKLNQKAGDAKRKGRVRAKEKS